MYCRRGRVGWEGGGGAVFGLAPPAPAVPAAVPAPSCGTGSGTHPALVAANAVEGGVGGVAQRHHCVRHAQLAGVAGVGDALAAHTAGAAAVADLQHGAGGQGGRDGRQPGVGRVCTNSTVLHRTHPKRRREAPNQHPPTSRAWLVARMVYTTCSTRASLKPQPWMRSGSFSRCRQPGAGQGVLRSAGVGGCLGSVAGAGWLGGADRLHQAPCARQPTAGTRHPCWPQNWHLRTGTGCTAAARRVPRWC